MCFGSKNEVVHPANTDGHIYGEGEGKHKVRMTKKDQEDVSLFVDKFCADRRDEV